MRNNYRVSADAPGPAVKPKPVIPGRVDANHIPVVDHKGQVRGHVGPLATAATAVRFGVPDARLQKQKIGGQNRQVWKGRAPTVMPRVMPRVTQQTAKLSAQLKQAKGSNRG
jgi:hypothetical protein